MRSFLIARSIAPTVRCVRRPGFGGARHSRSRGVVGLRRGRWPSARAIGATRAPVLTLRRCEEVRARRRSGTVTTVCDRLVLARCTAVTALAAAALVSTTLAAAPKATRAAKAERYVLSTEAGSGCVVHLLLRLAHRRWPRRCLRVATAARSQWLGLPDISRESDLSPSGRSAALCLTPLAKAAAGAVGGPRAAALRALEPASAAFLFERHCLEPRR